MSTPYEIPLSPEPQTFSIPLGSLTYWLTVRWCPPARAWTLDIADELKAPIISGIHLVTGVDLLGQYGYLGFKGRLIVQTDHDLGAVPTLENLGQTGHVYFVVD